MASKDQFAADSFDALDLSDDMMAALKAAGYEKPTPIQAGLIPLALQEGDVIGQARTGTGKTASFVVPIIELLDLKDRSHLLDDVHDREGIAPIARPRHGKGSCRLRRSNRSEYRQPAPRILITWRRLSTRCVARRRHRLEAWPSKGGPRCGCSRRSPCHSSPPP